MDLLQKLTLYDLLGYTLPGCVLLLVCGGSGMEWFPWVVVQGSGDVMVIFGLFCFGYILGIAMAECMEWILDKTGKSGISLKAFKKYNVDDDRIKCALKSAGIINDNEQESAFELFEKYKGEMYARIQVQGKYYRIHNYASFELLCKNMIFVSLVSAVSFLLKGNICGTLLGVIGSLCFIVRWQRFHDKKLGYCLGWFLDQYNLSNSN